MLRIKPILFLICVLGAAELFGLWMETPQAQDVWRRAAMPYRLAKLQLEPADRLLPVPVQGLRRKQIANTWKAPRPGDRKHEGQDIFARRGTPVISATRGVVTRVSDKVLGGKSVFVFGPGGRTYFYTHLDRYAEDLTPGAIVTPGMVLGYVGNTGNARTTPPHLHFGIYGPGGAINPLPLLSDQAPDLKRSSTST
jgi:peptidoglycan LD-endopeptidase LytH